MLKKEMTKLETIGSILQASLRKLGLQSGIKEHAIWDAWDGIVGDRIARFSQPESIKNGLLVIKVSDPVWMQQLQFMKDIIMAKVNEYFKESLVKRIYLKMGGSISKNVTHHEDIAPEKWNSIELNDNFLKKINLEVNKINDSHLRESVKKLMIKEEKLREYRRVNKVKLKFK